jgi:L-amino acid N-acyltransferase YncA
MAAVSAPPAVGLRTIVALFQAAPEHGAERSVSLLVHSGRRGAGYGTAALLAALDEPRYAGLALRAVVDRENVASLRCFGHCGFVADDDGSSARYAHLTLATAPRP